MSDSWHATWTTTKNLLAGRIASLVPGKPDTIDRRPSFAGHEKILKPPPTGFGCCKLWSWRWQRDSNPQWLTGPHPLSRRADYRLSHTSILAPGTGLEPATVFWTAPAFQAGRLPLSHPDKEPNCLYVLLRQMILVI